MTLAQLIKVHPNTYLKTSPEHFFIHNDIVLNLVTKERITLDYTKPLRPQLNINETLYIFQETNENNHLIKSYLETEELIGWLTSNLNKKIQCQIIKYLYTNQTKIKLYKTRKTGKQFDDQIIIFEKTIKNKDTKWQKIIWNETEKWIKKIIDSNGIIFERDHEHQSFKIIHPTNLPETEKIIKNVRCYERLR